MWAASPYEVIVELNPVGKLWTYQGSFPLLGVASTLRRTIVASSHESTETIIMQQK